MKRLIPILLSFALLLTACGISDSDQSQDSASTELFAMDTYMELKLNGSDSKEALTEVTDLINSLDKALSAENEKSDIYTLNHSDGNPVTVSNDAASLLTSCLNYESELDASFCISLYPISKLWGFIGGNYQVPEESQINTLLQNTDDSQIQIDGNTVTIPDGMEIDLGGAAKGYAADQAAEILKAHSITSALLNLGSSTIRAVGSKPDGSDWKVAIQDPEDDSTYAGIISASNLCISTSGGYERYFTDDDGNVYWHILDPQTGYPADSGLISVTILSDDSLSGDILSTSCFIMGVEETIQYYRNQGNFDFILITEGHEIYVSEGAEALFTAYGNYENAEITVISK